MTIPAAKDCFAFPAKPEEHWQVVRRTGLNDSLAVCTLVDTASPSFEALWGGCRGFIPTRQLHQSSDSLFGELPFSIASWGCFSKYFRTL
jgi:hypothetical protein